MFVGSGTNRTLYNSKEVKSWLRGKRKKKFM